MHIGQRATLVCLGLTLVSWSLNAAGAAWLEAQDFDELHLVVSSPADPVVQHAAERFQRLWAITTGHTPSLSAAPELHAINVWLGNENRFLPPRELAGLGNEGFYIKTIDAKQRLRVEEIGLRHRSRVPLRYRHLVIAGGSPRGLLYGVYEFFQAGLGWRWPTATYAEAPKVTAVPAMDYRYDPPFMLRDANLPELKPVSLAFNLRLNGPANTALPPQFGGTYIQAGTVLVNPSGVAAQASGKAPAPPPARDAILCLSDPARAGETAAAARVLLDKTTHTMPMISLRVDPGSAPCPCALCGAAPGGKAALLFAFAAEVARQVETYRPDAVIQLEMDSPGPAPQNLPPPPANLAVHVDTGMFPQSTRRALGRALGAWARVVQVFVTDHTLDRLTQPQSPGFDALQENLRFYKKEGVDGVYVALQAGRDLPDGELAAYLAGRLLWDPNLEAKELEREFRRLIGR